MGTLLSAKKLNDKIEAITSKSYVHRLLIAAALSGSPLFVPSNIVSQDMRATMECLNSLGACIKETPKGFEIVRGLSICTGEAFLDCGESGSTARFLLPLVCILCKSCKMTGHGKLPERPMEALTVALRKNNAVIDSDFLPLTTREGLEGGVFEIPGNISSQYITGLLFALPLLQKDSVIKLTSKLESSGYVDITIDVLKRFGIVIECGEGGTYSVPGNQSYRAPSAVEAEGDWSNSAYVLSLGAVDGFVNVSGLNPESFQGDREIADILSRFGADVSFDKGTYTVKKEGSLKAVTADVSDIPDLVPAIAAVASFAEGKTVLKNAGRLRIKESDRLEAIKKLLEAFDVKSYSEFDGGVENFVIEGGKVSAGKVIHVDSFSDHRIVMAAAIMSRGAGVPVEIDGYEAINKSFPGFASVFAPKAYGLVGEKLSHSFSKELHEAFDNAVYGLFEIPKDEIDSYFEEADFEALNVTIPYKEVALRHCIPDEAAGEIGAVNTIVKRDGKLYGYNTDYLGVEYMLKLSGISVSGKKVAVLGSGGTSKTVRYVCKRAKAAEIVTVSRNASEAGFVSYSQKAMYSDCDVLINTTPVGMFPNISDSPVSLDDFTNLEAVVDVVYNPLRTRLVYEARKRGIKAVNGLSMLVAQGFYAEELFKGHKEDESFVQAVLLNIIRRRENMVFIGMPGCGKTTSGRLTSEKTGRPFYDTDHEFEKTYGEKPGAYIEKYGEKAFRKLETEVIKNIAGMNGAVISTGGGSILDPGNVRLLKQNGRLIFIDRPLSQLSTEGRPLSQGGKLEKLYEERRPLYLAAADEIKKL